MKIWLITVGEPLPIEVNTERLYRTGLLAKHLASLKHEVVWWTSNFNHAKKAKWQLSESDIDTNKCLKINLLRGISYKSNVCLRRVFNHFQLALDFKKQVKYYEKPDIILCSYPTIELSFEAVKYALRNKVPVVIDVRDLWPESIENLFGRWMAPIIRKTFFFNFRQSKFIFQNASHIIAVSKKYLEYGIKKSNKQFDSENHVVFPIGYQKKNQHPNVEKRKQILSLLGIDEKKFICWFVGYFGLTYDLEPIIEAARILQLQGVTDIQFVFSGIGDKYTSWLKRASGCSNIVFTGWVNEEQLSAIGDTSKVGLQAYSHTAPQGLANKLFEYLSFGLPVLSSLKGENAVLIQKYNIGLTYEAKQPDSFLKALEKLYHDNELWEEMSKNGQILFENDFDNAKINQKIESYLSKIVRG